LRPCPKSIVSAQFKMEEFSVRLRRIIGYTAVLPLGIMCMSPSWADNCTGYDIGVTQRLLAPPSSGGKRGRLIAFGTLIVAVSRPAAWLEAFCADVNARLAQLAGVYAAASALPNGAGAAMRIAAVDGRHLRLGLQAGWSAARLHLSDSEATSAGWPTAGLREPTDPSSPAIKTACMSRRWHASSGRS
jgi:hypothetical protein